MDYQAFLTNELRNAADSTDHQGELQLFLLHYHQALLATIEALQELPLCSRCSAHDLRRLKMNARDLQHSDTRTQELIPTFNRRLKDTALLCRECSRVFQEELLSRFFVIRSCYAEQKKGGEE